MPAYLIDSTVQDFMLFIKLCQQEQPWELVSESNLQESHHENNTQTFNTLNTTMSLTYRLKHVV